GFCYFRVRQSDPGCLDLRYRPLCLVGIISVAIFSYANASPASAYSYAAIVLLLGATIGQGVGVWSEWNSNKPGEVAQSVVLILLLLLLGASLWSVDYLDRSPVYHGQIR